PPMGDLLNSYRPRRSAASCRPPLLISELYAEQFLGVSERDLFLGLAWQVHCPKPVGAFLHVREWIVGGKHHSIRTEVLQQKMQQFILKEGAGREPEIVMEVLLERLVQRALGRLTHLLHDAFVEERKALAHVADDDLQFGKSVEYPGRDHAKALSD